MLAGDVVAFPAFRRFAGTGGKRHEEITGVGEKSRISVSEYRVAEDGIATQFLCE